MELACVHRSVPWLAGNPRRANPQLRRISLRSKSTLSMGKVVRPTAHPIGSPRCRDRHWWPAIRPLISADLLSGARPHSGSCPGRTGGRHQSHGWPVAELDEVEPATTHGRRPHRSGSRRNRLGSQRLGQRRSPVLGTGSCLGPFVSRSSTRPTSGGCRSRRAVVSRDVGGDPKRLRQEVSLQKKLIFQQNAGDSSRVFRPSDLADRPDFHSNF